MVWFFLFSGVIMQNVLDELKDANDARIFAENIIATIREPLLVLDGDLRVVFVNSAFSARFHVSNEESVGTLVYELGNGQWDIPKLREALTRIIHHGSHFDDYEVEHDFPHIGLLTLGPVANRATTIPLPSASAYPRVPSSQRGWMWTQMFDGCDFRVE